MSECEHKWNEFISSWWYFCFRKCKKCDKYEGYGPWVTKKNFIDDPFVGPPPEFKNKNANEKDDSNKNT